MQIILARSTKRSGLYLRNTSHNLDFLDDFTSYSWAMAGPNGLIANTNMFTMNFYDPNRPYKEVRNAMRYKFRSAHRNLRYALNYHSTNMKQLADAQKEYGKYSNKNWQDEFWDRLGKEIEVQILDFNMHSLRAKEHSVKPLYEYYPKTIKIVN